MRRGRGSGPLSALRSVARSLRTGLARVLGGFRVGRLLRHPPSPGDYAVELRDRLARREASFLWMVEHRILGHERSPYRILLAHAGYDLPRLKELVGSRGLDGALDQLRADGVYVRIDEFKGWRPIERGGRSFRVSERDFANPAARNLFEISSSGSRSRGTPVNVPREDLLQQGRLRRWLLAGYGLTGKDAVIWATPGFGLGASLELALAGAVPVRWFSPVAHTKSLQSLLIRIARLVSRLPLRDLEVAPAARAAEVARELGRLNTRRGLVVETFTGSALRLVLAAAEEKVTLGDVSFVVSGEPITVHKREQIEKHGFRVFPRFAFNELGRMAWACTSPRQPDDVHVMTDMVAVRQYPRPLDDGVSRVGAYLFTTLLPYARNIMLNMESGDYGELEERACGCFLDHAGFGLHMHSVRSFEKLSAEGMTFAGPDLIRLLEEILPREFGGDSRHYQLVEDEDGTGFTRLYLLASPQLGPLDEGALRRAVLEGIGDRPFRRVVSGVWEGADTIRVLRREPLPTIGGKILHLHRHRGALQP